MEELLLLAAVGDTVEKPESPETAESNPATVEDACWLSCDKADAAADPEGGGVNGRCGAKGWLGRFAAATAARAAAW